MDKKHQPKPPTYCTPQQLTVEALHSELLVRKPNYLRTQEAAVTRRRDLLDDFLQRSAPAIEAVPLSTLDEKVFAANLARYVDYRIDLGNNTDVQAEIRRWLTDFSRTYMAMTWVAPKSELLPPKFGHRLAMLCQMRFLTGWHIRDLGGLPTLRHYTDGRHRVTCRMKPHLEATAKILHVPYETLIDCEDTQQLRFPNSVEQRTRMMQRTDYSRWLATRLQLRRELKEKTGVGLAVEIKQLSSEQKAELKHMFKQMLRHKLVTIRGSTAVERCRVRNTFRQRAHAVLRFYAYLFHWEHVPLKDLTLALWLDHDRVKRYLEYIKAEGVVPIYHGGHMVVMKEALAIAKVVLPSLLHLAEHKLISPLLSDHYEEQHPHFGAIPRKIDRADPNYALLCWRGLCMDSYSRFVKTREIISSHRKRQPRKFAREPLDGSEKILRWKNPFLALQLLLSRHMATKSTQHTFIQRATWSRDAALIVAVMLLAPRVEELHELRLNRHVFLLPDGGLRILALNHMRKGAGYGADDFHIDLYPVDPIPGGTDPIMVFREWLEKYLPRMRSLDDREHPSIFPCVYNFGPDNTDAMNSLSTRLRLLTARYLSEITTAGWSVHAVRHLLAGGFKAAGTPELAHNMLRNRDKTAEGYGTAWNPTEARQAIRIARLMFLLPPPADVESAAAMEPLFEFNKNIKPVLSEMQPFTQWLQVIQLAKEASGDQQAP